jgi:hypothetical protein
MTFPLRVQSNRGARAAIAPRKRLRDLFDAHLPDLPRVGRDVGLFCSLLLDNRGKISKRVPSDHFQSRPIHEAYLPELTPATGVSMLSEIIAEHAAQT